MTKPLKLLTLGILPDVCVGEQPYYSCSYALNTNTNYMYFVYNRIEHNRTEHNKIQHMTVVFTTRCLTLRWGTDARAVVLQHGKRGFLCGRQGQDQHRGRGAQANTPVIGVRKGMSLGRSFVFLSASCFSVGGSIRSIVCAMCMMCMMCMVLLMLPVA